MLISMLSSILQAKKKVTLPRLHNPGGNILCGLTLWSLIRAKQLC